MYTYIHTSLYIYIYIYTHIYTYTYESYDTIYMLPVRATRSTMQGVGKPIVFATAGKQAQSWDLGVQQAHRLLSGPTKRGASRFEACEFKFLQARCCARSK